MSDSKTRVIELFREYDCTGGFNPSSFALIKNMYRDRYSRLIESVPGFRRIVRTERKTDALAIMSIKGQPRIIYKEGDKLCVARPEDRDTGVIYSFTESEGRFFILHSTCYIADGNRLYRYDGSELSVIAEGEIIRDCRGLALLDARLFLLTREGIYPSTELEGREICFSRDTLIATEDEALTLVSGGDCLWVFHKSGILCYGREGYARLRHIEGINPTGEAMLLDGRIILLTEDGPRFIEDCHLPERARVTRPTYKLLSLLSAEEMREASLCSLEGYAAICSGSRILLLDPETSECFLISDVGSYKGDKRVYRYSPITKSGFSTHRQPNTPANAEVMSIITEEKETVYYTEEDERLYLVYPTNERSGGELCPPIKYASGCGLLCFATEGGILLFNTDMRGVMPEGETGGDARARKIHPSFYSFDSHAIGVSIITEYEDAGLPFAEKSSSGESLRLRILTEGPIFLSVRVMTDKGEASRQKIHAAPKLTGEYSLTPTVIGLSERAHGWLEKQIAIETDEFCSPFALSAIAFKFQQRKN